MPQSFLPPPPRNTPGPWNQLGTLLAANDSVIMDSYTPSPLPAFCSAAYGVCPNSQRNERSVSLGHEKFFLYAKVGSKLLLVHNRPEQSPFYPSRASARVSDYELFIGYIWKDLLVRTRLFLLHAGGSLSSALYCLTFILIPPHPRPPSLVSDLPSLPHPHSSIRPSRPTPWLIGRRRKLSLWRVVSLLRV